MKKVSKKDVELICHKIDSEGFDYCFTDYSDWKKETAGTALRTLIDAFNKARGELEDAINELREEYGIDEE